MKCLKFTLWRLKTQKTSITNSKSINASNAGKFTLCAIRQNIKSTLCGVFALFFEALKAKKFTDFSHAKRCKFKKFTEFFLKQGLKYEFYALKAKKFTDFMSRKFNESKKFTLTKNKFLNFNFANPLKPAIFAVFLTLFASQSVAITSFEFAKNLTGGKDDGKLELLFAQNEYIDENGEQNLAEITRILKQNSLLHLTLSRSADIIISFKGATNGHLLLKIINESLNQAGLVHFMPISFEAQNEQKFYAISVQSRYILDPASFYGILKQNSVFIKNVRKISEFHYEYELDFSKARLKPTHSVPFEHQTTLTRPLRDYLFYVNGASKIELATQSSGAWYPKILFLDKNLKLIKDSQSAKKARRVRISVPSNAYYAVVGDRFSLDNLRRGLSVYLYR